MTCTHCGVVGPEDRFFRVTPPAGSKDDEPFAICEMCWERMVGLAMLGAVR